MTIGIDKVLAQFGDRYDRNARLAPALLVLLPAVVAIIALYGKSLGILGTVVSTIGLCGGWVMLADWARSRGKATEQALWRKWGGPPSTQVLRYKDETFDDLSKSRYHKVLQKKVGKPFPASRAAEAANPAAADVLYASGCNWLRENTRDEKKISVTEERQHRVWISPKRSRSEMAGRDRCIRLHLLGAVTAWHPIDIGSTSCCR